ncbi:MAG: SipW-dependent-type signal peptide-containing protein, partial [Oscillospiraceae bacterium]|nr:SipW-dependent-type signal peptide-containing protein [Oscillospiraceae bacterium]
MNKSKNTRRALHTSLLSLLLCVSMLLGTTFAWFTDSVASTGNIIKSGTLDVEM